MAKDSIAVLIIDGNDKTRSFSVDRLNASSAKYRIYEASSGTAGLKLCKKYSFDCVVVSLALPDISGLQVLVNLVPVTSKPTVPVIVLTETSALLEDIVKKGCLLRSGEESPLWGQSS
jgi:DNA-binding response OmpR family regulator